MENNIKRKLSHHPTLIGFLTSIPLIIFGLVAMNLGYILDSGFGIQIDVLFKGTHDYENTLWAHIVFSCIYVIVVEFITVGVPSFILLMKKRSDKKKHEQNAQKAN